MNASYLAIIQSHWEEILNLYLKFEEERPVMVFDMDKNEVFAYPYQDFRTRLKPKSQALLVQQYQQALEKNHMVIFVKDDDNNTMASFSVKIYED